MSDPRKLGEGVLKALELDKAFQKPVDSPSPGSIRGDAQLRQYDRIASAKGFAMPPGRTTDSRIYIGVLELEPCTYDFVWSADFNEMQIYLIENRYAAEHRVMFVLQEVMEKGLTVQLSLRPKENHNPWYRMNVVITEVNRQFGPKGAETMVRFVRKSPVNMFTLKDPWTRKF